MEITQEVRIKRGHIAMMKHPETALYSGVMMMGETSVDDKPITAYTDGINKRYGRAFLTAVCKEDSEVNGLILHENLHIVLRHMMYGRDMFMENKNRANRAADYVVNGIIMAIKDKKLVKLPDGALYDPRFDNMNMRQVYNILKDEEEEGGGGGGKGKPEEGGGPSNDSGQGEYQFDDHDFEGEGGGQMTDEEMKEMDGKIDRAIREGAILAGRLGVDLPRAITEMLEPHVDWKRETQDFVSSTCKGKDEYTWRRFNRRMLPNDLFLPTVENETIGEIVVGIDTSGSIQQEQLNEFAAELVSIAEAVHPEAIRILWWDTKVHGEQLFTDNYEQIGSMLKPEGGGGTRVSCVSEYINKKKINAECVVVFTDGYLENDVVWNINSPTLWLVTENKHWTPPAGKLVFVNK
jgi:predicted metal-dependent peptidase